MPSRSTVPSCVSDVDIVVLAGGLGTRLDGLLTDVPKIMAPIGGHPFLEYVLGWLIEQGAARVILGLGHRARPVIEYLEAHAFPRLEILTAVEPRPLGTAGALGFASSYFRSDPVMVMNGDTFIEADLSAFLASHQKAGTTASVLSVKVHDPQRYGRIEIDSASRITRFEEKSSAATAPSWVNAGVYLFDRAILERIAKLEHGSLERDVLEALPPGSVHACRAEGRFLDIGTPESLAQASAFFDRQDPIRRELNS
jgi:NDP-sugar pyrophosphorylase family protein